jgi:predicted RNA-binding Zn-ribbon protein involved in translation (DUF1610 family)
VNDEPATDTTHEPATDNAAQSKKAIKKAPRVVCPECGLTLGNAGALVAHMRSKHGASGRVGRPAVKPAAKTPHKCPECGKHFANASGMSSHRRSAHGVKASSPEYLRARAQLKSRAPLKSSTLKPIFVKGGVKCPECGVVYKAPSGLALHRKAAHSIAPSSASHLRFLKVKNAQSPPSSVSASTHTTQASVRITGAIAGPPFACPECGLEYSFARGLGKHRTTKHGVPAESPRTKAQAGPPFVCSECGESFTLARMLGHHRKWKHGVAGRLNHNGNAHEPANEAAAMTHTQEQTNGRADQVTLARTNGHSQAQQQPNRDELLSESTAAFALGRLTEFCKAMADEYDLPARSFTRRLAALWYTAQTVR